MEHQIAKLLKDCERGTIGRRQLLQALGLSATAAFAVSALPRAAAAFDAGEAQAAAAGGKAFPVITVNHLGLATANYAKSRDFYVDLFGMRVVWDDGIKCDVDFGSLTAPNGMYITQGKPGATPVAGHISYGMPDFWPQRTAIKAEMERRGLKNIRADGEAGWMVDTPGGYMIQPVPLIDKAMFPGAASPCEVAASTKCQEGYAAGVKNLNAIPKASGKGFKALAFSPLVFNVPDIARERDFYTSLLGMKVISTDPKTGECFLRFGQNTLCLRKAATPGDKTTCSHFSLLLENYDQAKVEAELKRRGLNPKADATGFTFADPDGFSIGVSKA